MKFTGALLLAFVLLVPIAGQPIAAAGHPHQFCFHHGTTLSLCLWDGPAGIGVLGTARLRNVRFVSSGESGLDMLVVGPIRLSPYIGSRRAGNMRDVTFPVIGTEWTSGADVIRYHLEVGNTNNALLLYPWSNCEPSCAAATRRGWRLAMDVPRAAGRIALVPGP